MSTRIIRDTIIPAQIFRNHRTRENGSSRAEEKARTDGEMESAAFGGAGEEPYKVFAEFRDLNTSDGYGSKYACFGCETCLSCFLLKNSDSETPRL
jgi:hypothetical protein